MGVIFITHDMGVVAGWPTACWSCIAATRLRRAVRTRSSPGRSIHARAAVGGAAPGAMHGTDEPAPFPLLRGRRGQGRAASVGSSPGPCRPALDRAARERPVLKVRDLTTTFDITGGILGRVQKRVHAVRRSVSTCTPARRCRWWASPAAARPPPAVRCCSWSRAGPAPSNSTARTSARCAARHADAAPASSVHLPGPLRLAGSAHDGRLLHHGAAADPRRGARKAAEERVRWLMDKCGLLPR